MRNTESNYFKWKNLKLFFDLNVGFIGGSEIQWILIGWLTIFNLDINDTAGIIYYQRISCMCVCVCVCLLFYVLKICRKWIKISFTASRGRVAHYTAARGGVCLYIESREGVCEINDLVDTFLFLFFLYFSFGNV